MKILRTASGKSKIKMSKKEWSDIGKKAGWMKKAQFEENMMPGQTSYTNDERDKLHGMVGDAATAIDQIGEEELDNDDNVSRRRTVKVHLSDGDIITTGINGTKQEIEDYYKNNEFVAEDEVTMRSGVQVEFLS